MTTARNLIDLCLERAEECGEQPLFTELERGARQGRTLSFADLRVVAAATAAALLDRGFQGQPALLMYSQGTEFIKAFYGCIFARVIPVPLAMPRGSSSDQERLQSIVKSSGARIILTTGASLASIGDMVQRLSLNMSLLSTDTISADLSRTWSAPRIRPEQLAFVQYTSGSTQQPKGVAISHSNVMDNLARATRHFAIQQGDVGVSWLPFFHDMGLIGHVLTPVYAKARNYFMSPLAFVADPVKWLRAITVHRAHLSGAPNFAYELCSRKIQEADVDTLDLRSWRVAYCGAERIRKATCDEFLAKFERAGFRSSTFNPCYGLAESTVFVCGRSSVVTAGEDAQGEAYISVGQLLPDSGVEIIDPEDQRPCGPGQVGEICLRSPSVAQGYYNSPELTRAAFGVRIGDHHDYFRTGDLGFVREDDLYFVGRRKNLIKIRGKSYHAEDIEAATCALGGTSHVTRCMAAASSTANVESILVFVEIEDSASLPSEQLQFIAAELRSKLSIRIGASVAGLSIVAKGTIPLTSSGKVRRDKPIELAPALAAVVG